MATTKTNETHRLAKHPMFSASDLAYLRGKGYSDDEVLAFWDRDHAHGCKPCHHREATDALIEALRENLSPEAVVAIACYLQGAKTKDEKVNREVGWFHQFLVEFLGVEEYNRMLEDLCL